MSLDIENRLSTIEDRLSRIEKSLNLPRPQPRDIQLEAQSNQKSIDDWADDGFPDPPHKIAANEKPLNWLGIVAIFCFVLAAGFIIKLSIDSGWLTPARQIGLSALLGFGLIGAGLKLMSTDRDYASLLPGAGVIILYLTTLGGYFFYHLISFEVSLILIALVTALCIGLYIKIQHNIYAITASLGAYTSPLLLGGSLGYMTLSLSYFLFVSVAFAVISIFVKSRVLLLISANLAIVMTSLVGLDMPRSHIVPLFLGFHFAIFSISTYLYSEKNKAPLSSEEAWSFFPVLLAFYGMEYYFISQIAPTMAPFISLGFAGFLWGLYFSAKKLFQNGLGSQKLIIAFTTLACFHSLYIEIIPPLIQPWMLVLIVMVGTFTPNSMITHKNNTDVYFIPLFTIAIIALIEYVSIIGHLFDKNSLSWMMVSFACLISIWILLVRKTDFLKEKFEIKYAILAAAHIQAIFGFYRWTIEIGSLAVSASWLLYAVAVMLFASVRKDDIMAKSALIVLAFAAGKALLYDAANAPTIIRILCLLLTGAVLYGCGFFMKRLSTWTSIKQE